MSSNSALPQKMRALVALKYGQPSEYQISSEFPTPKISEPSEIIIKCHAASINPVDVKLANGLIKMMQTEKFPYQIGYDVAGTVAAVGGSVTKFKVGDKVFSRIPTKYRGSVADFVLTSENAVAAIPNGLTYVEAAGVPLAALTAFQCMKRADKFLPGGLKGKTVVVPAGLSGTGSFGVQIAKNIFGAARVITTLSTGKIERAKELFGSDIEIIDYTKSDPGKSIAKQSVDHLFDTTGSTLSLLHTVKRGGIITTISTVPGGTTIQQSFGMTNMPSYLRLIMDSVDWMFRWWTKRAGVDYSYTFMSPSGSDLDFLRPHIESGAVKPVIGRVAKLSDLQGVRDGCQQVFDGKGGVGKFVIDID